MGVGTVVASLNLATKESELRQAKRALREVTPTDFPELQRIISDGEITPSELRGARSLARQLEQSGDYDGADAVTAFVEQAKCYRDTKSERDRAIMTLGAAYVAERDDRWYGRVSPPLYDRYQHHRSNYDHHRYPSPPRYGRNYEAEAWVESQRYHRPGYSERFRESERAVRENRHFINRDLSKTNDWRGNPIEPTPTTAAEDRPRYRPMPPRRDRTY